MALTHDQITELSKLDERKFTLLLISNWLTIGLSLALSAITRNYAVYLFSIIIIGTRLHALNFLGHDVTHRLAYKNKKLNDFIGNIFCLAPSLVSISHYKNFHMEHHRHLNTKADPEIEYRAAFSYFWKLPLRVPNYILTTIVDLTGIGIFEALFLSRYVKKGKVIDFIIPYVLWTIGILIFVKLDLAIVPIIYIISYLTFGWFFLRTRARFEHLNTEKTHIFKGNAFTNYMLFPHNAWCHHEHHEYPSIPCYNLAQARELDKESMSKEITFRELCQEYMSEQFNPKYQFEKLKMGST